VCGEFRTANEISRTETKEVDLAVPVLLNSFEQSAFSSWLRDSDSYFGFYFILLVHTLGLSLLVGANLVVDLRILGVASELPLQSVKRLFRIMWMGFWLNATTGLLLLAAYPTKSLTNPVFYVKLSLIGLAVFTMQKINSWALDDASNESNRIATGRKMAKLSIALWLGAITAGRLLAYTYTYLLYGVYALLVFKIHS
jgi:hypothetical protein